MGSSCMSKSPNSESTDDNSFERVSEPNDDLFESLISYFGKILNIIIPSLKIIVFSLQFSLIIALPSRVAS
jgi:hypothetical protein